MVAFNTTCQEIQRKQIFAAEIILSAIRRLNVNLIRILIRTFHFNKFFFCLVAVDLLTNRKISCSCLPACFEIAYDKTITSSILSDGSFGIIDDIFVGRTKEYVK